MLLQGFHWILPDRLAGAARPGLFHPLDEDLSELSRRGIRWIVSLTERPLETPPSSEIGVIHFPVQDMGAPTSPATTHELCARILRAVDDSEGVLLHCRAGLGRTGTLLACCLVERGFEPRAAIDEMRRINRLFIQSLVQEAFIEHYGEFLRTSATGELPVLLKLKIPV